MHASYARGAVAVTTAGARCVVCLRLRTLCIRAIGMWWCIHGWHVIHTSPLSWWPVSLMGGSSGGERPDCVCADCMS